MGCIISLSVDFMSYCSGYGIYQFKKIMNMFALPDKTVDLDPRWNESFCCGQSDNPGIVHFAGFPNWFTDPTVPRREYLEKYLNTKRPER